MEMICASVTALPKKQKGFRLEAPCFYGCGGPQPDPPTGACKAIERTSNGLRNGCSVMRQLHFHRLGPAQTQPGQDGVVSLMGSASTQAALIDRGNGLIYDMVLDRGQPGRALPIVVSARSNRIQGCE
jgi:hypothetical protein